VMDFFSGTMELIKEQEIGKELFRRALTANGEVSKNPNLNGFIAENWHELTFNFNARQSGGSFRAKALIPEHRYAKNSMDLGIYQNGAGKAVGRYQAKYGANPEATLQYKNHGDYRGQKLLVPEGQEQYINGSVNQMKAPDGTVSDPISKAKAVEIQNQMQNGTFKQNMAIQLAKGAAIEMAKGALIGGAITATVETISLYSEYKNGKISGKDYLKEIGKAAGDGAATGGLTAGLMIPVQAGIAAVAGTAIASCPLVTIPVTFLIGTAVNKLVAPAFGRGDYQKILGEAKYYQNLMNMNTDLIQALHTAQFQFESFFEEYVYQIQEHQQLTSENQALKELHQKANIFIDQKNNENAQLLSCLGDLYATI
ncbi:MAG: hypothetical protein NC548_53080, partial [Lachnospiraceae bacterium]|nr:hypothetical protein [Lachnospiraceae bacterium]MCM1235596.1 hypothetical protein [Ruminococcus flavefaciens]